LPSSPGLLLSQLVSEQERAGPQPGGAASLGQSGEQLLTMGLAGVWLLTYLTIGLRVSYEDEDDGLDIGIFSKGSRV
jgi:hypothetical protein